MNAIFSSLGLGVKVVGSKKFNVDTATPENHEWVVIVSVERRVIGEGVMRDEIRSVLKKYTLEAGLMQIFVLLHRQLEPWSRDGHTYCEDRYPMIPSPEVHHHLLVAPDYYASN